MKVTLKYGENSTTYENVKDVVLYRDGDRNTGVYVSIQYNTSGSVMNRYTNIHTKPDSIKVEN